MKKIKAFNIDDSYILAVATEREFSISGDIGAKVNLYVRNEDYHYYNFDTKAFQASYTGETSLNIAIPDSGVYKNVILFPAVSDDDQYDIHLFVDTLVETVLDSALSSNPDLSFSPYFYETYVKQKVDTVITFSVATTDADGWQAMPSNITLTKPPLSSQNENVTISWSVLAIDADTGGGLEEVRQPLSSDFKIEKTQTSIGTGSSATTIYFSSVDGLVVGMALTAITSGSVSGSPTITKINTLAKSVIVSVAQSWADNKVITFKGSGIRDILNSSGCEVVFKDLKTEMVPFTGTVNGAVSASDNIVLDSVHGIRVGSTISGIGFDNTSTRYVLGIDYGANQISVGPGVQTLADNTILTFDGSSKQADITGIATVTKIPDDNITLTLDLDALYTSALT